MAEACYFCGAPATSREHVPPACLFPEQKDLANGVDYRKNLVTVPSCDAHNAAKSHEDEYLQLILIFGYFNNAAGRAHFNAKVVRALTRRPAILAALYAGQTPVMVDAQPTVAVDIDRVRFNSALERVCQGLCVSQTGKRWPKPIEIHTPVLLAMNEPDCDKINQLVTNLSKAVVEYLKNQERRGDNPDIFWYQLLVDEAKERLVCRMVFYGGFDVFAVSDARLRTLSSSTLSLNPDASPAALTRRPLRAASLKTAKPPPNQEQSPKNVGRNEPCPSGSGKKYKKCCGKLR